MGQDIFSGIYRTFLLCIFSVGGGVSLGRAGLWPLSGDGRRIPPIGDLIDVDQQTHPGVVPVIPEARAGERIPASLLNQFPR